MLPSGVVRPKSPNPGEVLRCYSDRGHLDRRKDCLEHRCFGGIFKCCLLLVILTPDIFGLFVLSEVSVINSVQFLGLSAET